MALHRWPTDPAGKPPSHSISWQQHQANLFAQNQAQQTAANQNAQNAARAAASAGPPKGLTPQQLANIPTAQGGTMAAPAASAGPASPPPDPALDGLIAGAASRRDNRVTDIGGQRTRTLVDYGYTQTGTDASGNPVLAFDTNNPYSRAALMKRTYEHRQAGTTNSMAASGHLYSGARHRALRTNEFGYQQGSDALLRALVDALGGLTRAERDARTNYDTEVAGYRAQRAPAS